MTVVASRQGVYRLSDSDVRIHYHSWRRSRQIGWNTDLCLLVARPADYQRLLRQEENFDPNSTDLGSVDPLVASYEQCLSPS